MLESFRKNPQNRRKIVATAAKVRKMAEFLAARRRNRKQILRRGFKSRSVPTQTLQNHRKFSAKYRKISANFRKFQQRILTAKSPPLVNTLGVLLFRGVTFSRGK